MKSYDEDDVDNAKDKFHECCTAAHDDCLSCRQRV